MRNNHVRAILAAILPIIVLLCTACGNSSQSPQGATATVSTATPFLIPATPFPQPTGTGPLPTDTLGVVPSVGAGDNPTATLPESKATATLVENSPIVSSGRIIYLDKDGVTVKGISVDGGSPDDVFTIKKNSEETVDYLTADPTGQHILYTLTGKDYTPGPYYLFHNGQVKTLQPFALRPAWSPDGKQFVSQLLRSDAFGPIYIYDLASGEGRELSQVGGANWFPDGKRLVYVSDDVYTYDLESKTSTRLTQLPSTEQDKWTLQEAQVLPDGEHIIFFGGQYLKNGEPQFGASGNGEQWWWLPIGGGVPQPWTEPEGNGVLYFASNPTVNKVAYVGGTHYSACVSLQTLSILGAGVPAAKPFVPDIPELNDANQSYVMFNGLAWSPRGDRIFFSVTPYRCADAGSDQVASSPVLYALDIGTGATTHLRKIVEGTYPSWVR